MVELPWGDEWVEQEIREGLLEDEQWAPMGVARPVPGEYFEQFGGVLPSSVLYVWRRLGFEGFGGGRFWITDPLEWAPAVEAWLEDVVLPFPEQSWWCLGRTALGQMCLWGEVSGPALIIDALDGFLNPDADNAEKMLIRWRVSAWAASCSPSRGRTSMWMNPRGGRWQMWGWSVWGPWAPTRCWASPRHCS